MIDRPGDDLDPDEEAEPGDFDEELGAEPVVTVDITGLSIYTHHGVGEAEREVGQRLVFDISFELDRCDATVTDRLDEIVAIGRPVVVGTSRKSFLGKLVGGRSEDERLPGTIATSVIAWQRGATVFRVHDVAQVVDALAVAAATVGAP